MDSSNIKIRDNRRELENQDSKYNSEIRFYNSLKTKIDDIERRKTNRLYSFGKTMVEIVRTIDQFERERKWVGVKPFGPLGIF